MNKDPSSSSSDVLIDLQDVFFQHAKDTYSRSLFWQLHKDPSLDGKFSLSGVSFRVHAGERVVVIGHNGSGKSTLLSIIAGKRLAKSGRVRALGGRDPFQETSLSGDIAFIGETWPPEAYFGCSVDRIASEAPFPLRKAALAEALHLRLDRPVDRMSTGEKRRVQILHGMLRPAKVYLLDECSTDLDIVERQTVLALVREECVANGGCCLYATHIMDRLDDWATHVLLMKDGRVVDFLAVKDISVSLEQLALDFMLHPDAGEGEGFNGKRGASPARDTKRGALSILTSPEPFERYGKDGIPHDELQQWQDIFAESPSYVNDQSPRLPFGAGDRGAEAIICSDLSFKEVFHHMNFSVYRGERVLLCGCNGSGKSTLLNMLGGKQYFNNASKALQIMGKTCYDDMTFLSQVAYGGDWWTKAPRGEVYVREILSLNTRRAKWLCEVLAVNLDWEVSCISSGEQRRVQILLYLLEDKPVVLLDEATADLDVNQRYALLKFLYLESACRGVTIVYATHIYSGLNGWANVLILLDRTKRGVHAVRRARDGDVIEIEYLTEELAKLKYEEKI
ncbi:unnamed protein product [Phytomonas sp. EM1]|nr:unnamed protein product [Phytomonas sp. EM1]|eukprot:CCW61665.1 unnamed protein product [Phytomonas sp. isolate EM1]